MNLFAFFGGQLGFWEILIIAIAGVVLFGRRLPEVGRYLGKGIIERDIETTVPDKSTELILYCGGGYRSALAADALEQIGYTNVFSMAGGWKAWRDSGGEIE